jgi:xylan 1,4-beta-xylosidase
MGDSLVKVGGPALSGSSGVSGIPNFLRHCLTGTNAATGKVGTKVDFVTYHRYGTDPECSGSVANAVSMSCFHKQMVDVVKQFPAFKGELINNEWGPNSGINTARDLELCASFVAKTVHLLNENGPSYPPPAMYGYWALSDLYEENQNNTNRYTFAEATQGIFLRGDPTISDSWEIGKPSYEAFRMLHKLGAWEVSCTGGKTTDGLNAVATVSTNNDSIQILIYNHYDNTQQPTTVDNVTLTVDSIPFAPAQVRAEHWVVDYSHSNAYRPWVTMGKPAKPTAAQWAQLKQAAMLTHYDSVATPTLSGKSWSKTFTQNYYSVGLIILTKAGGVSTAPARLYDALQTFRASIQGKNVIVAAPFAGTYKVQLFTTGGRKIAEKQAYGPGRSVVSLANVPTGAYVLKCNSPANSLKSLVIVE